MQKFVKSILVSLLIVSCGTTEKTPYRDTTKLELPPALRSDKPVVNLSEVDDSSIPEKKAKTGLGDAVYMTASKPPSLKVKQTFNNTWNTLESALKQSEIIITDRELDKGLYYITYDPDDYVPKDEAFTDRMTAFFSDEYSKASYVLTLTADGSETQISAALADNADADDQQQDKKIDSDKTDGAEKLLLSIYETMRDDLVEE